MSTFCSLFHFFFFFDRVCCFIFYRIVFGIFLSILFWNFMVSVLMWVVVSSESSMVILNRIFYVYWTESDG